MLIDRVCISELQALAVGYSGGKQTLRGKIMDNPAFISIIPAVIAVIAVALAKDTKVSEFRQQWADELRKDVSTYLAMVVRAYEYKNPVSPLSDTEKATIRDFLMELNTVMHRITLRLDLKDKTKKKKPDQWRLGQALSDAKDAVLMTPGNQAAMNKCSEEIQEAAAVVIDNAWTKVRQGEPLYRGILRLAYCILIACVLTLVYQMHIGHNDPATTHIRIDDPIKIDATPSYPIRVQQPPPPITVPQLPMNAQPQHGSSQPHNN